MERERATSMPERAALMLDRYKKGEIQSNTGQTLVEIELETYLEWTIPIGASSLDGGASSFDVRPVQNWRNSTAET